VGSSSSVQTVTQDAEPWVRRHSFLAFVGLTYAISWSLWLVAALGGGTVPFLLGALGPMAAAAVVTRARGESLAAWLRPAWHWRVSPVWWLYALGLPAALYVVVSLVLQLLGEPVDWGLAPDRLPGYAATFVFVLFLGGAMEEPGWRGFGLPLLEEQRTPVRATLLLGLAWGIWHVPVYGPAGFVVPMVLAFFYTVLWNRTHSVLLCILLHASFTPAQDELVLMPHDSAYSEVLDTPDWVILATYVVAALVLVAVTRGRLGLPPAVVGPRSRPTRALGPWPLVPRPTQAGDMAATQAHATPPVGNEAVSGGGPTLAAGAQHAGKIYGEGETAVTALDDVTLELPAGEFTAIMGPSGSGKSTLMHCLAGLDTLTTGTVFIGATDLASLSDRERTLLRRDRLGFVFQSFNLLPMLTAEENITLPADLAGRTPDAEWLQTVIAKLNIADRLRHRPSELSGGQQQRVAVGRALISKPEVVFADEPTGALDSKAGTELLRFLRSVVDDLGQTVVMVTHDPGAAAYADRVVFLADGAIVEELVDPTKERVLEIMGRLGG
jgi:putative ABC transport system ATP-binding protein